LNSPEADATRQSRDDARWRSIVARERAADGSFVYSVISTGVFCRPSCPSRQAKRENVRFFETTGEAVAAGYRPCKRCRPIEPFGEGLRQKIVAACRAIESSEEPPKLATLAARSGLSPAYFHRIFKAETGLTPKAFADARRRIRLSETIKGSASVTAAIYESGFNSSGRFYAQSDALLGMKPRAFRQGGEEVEIRFALGQCALGAILVAASEKGICAISLGDDPEKLLREFQNCFSRASLIGGDADFEGLVAKVIGFVEAPNQGLNLPLDLRGTAFQQRVWQALRRIPAGATASYSDVAREIGDPRAVRGVAGACAKNLIAVAIPCHRVVRADGALSGYRWGVERKRELLDRESIPASHARSGKSRS